MLDPHLTDELQCPICMDMLQEPCSLGNCQHTFCRKCIVDVIGTDDERTGQVKCPICRKRSRVPDELPENKLLKTVVDATRRATQEACPHHPETRAEYFCNTCDVITCDKCALLGGHRGHDICELATAAAACRAGLQRVQAGVSEREQAAAAARGRIDATYNGLKSRVDEEAQAVIDEVNRQRVIAKQDLDMHARREIGARSLPTALALRTVVEAKIASLPRADGQATMLRAAERGLAELQAPAWGQAQVEDALRGFEEGNAPFKAIQQLGRQLGVQAAAGGGRAFQIFVTGINGKTNSTKKSLTINVRREMTVRELKESLVGLTGVPVDLYRLVSQGKVLEDRKMIADYPAIDKGATVEMRKFITTRAASTIKVRVLDLNIIEVHVTPEDTIHDVKGKIYDILLESRGDLPTIGPNDQILEFNGVYLFHNRRLHDSGIGNDATLVLHQRKHTEWLAADVAEFKRQVLRIGNFDVVGNFISADWEEIGQAGAADGYFKGRTPADLREKWSELVKEYEAYLEDDESDDELVDDAPGGGMDILQEEASDDEDAQDDAPGGMEGG